MQTLQINNIPLTPTPSGDTVCSVYYSLDSDPTNFVLISNSVTVHSDGSLVNSLVVNNIPDSETGVTVRAVANCGGTPFDKHIGSGTTTTTTTAGTTTTTTAATTTTTTTAGTTTTTTAATTTTTTTAGTTTTTTAATTTTTTTAGTTTTTTAGTTTTTTTLPESFDLNLDKEIPNDTVSIAVTLGGNPVAGSPFVSASGEASHAWANVFDSATSFYQIDVTVTPSGRPNAPILVSDNSGQLVNDPGGTHDVCNHDGAQGNVNVSIGA